nr:RHS repeat-associated core domain-containing protein [Aliidiomarina quisquiliarum]
MKQQIAYDPWGKQATLWSHSQFIFGLRLGEMRGYTGHTMVNDLNLIHMGGRTYNPMLGRFMQADPFIQAGANLQNYNRYSYVLNNPLSYTDPSGYLFKRLNKAFGNFAPFVGMAASFFLGGAGGFFVKMGIETAASQVFAGLIAGGVATGNLRGAAVGAISGAMFHSFSGMAASPTRAFVSGVGGGFTSMLGGGAFHHGFVSAGMGQVVNNAGGDLATSVILGGTASQVVGGKFANGAVTAALSSLLSREINDVDSASPDFSQMTNEELTDWLFENRDLFEIDIPNNIELIYSPQHTGFFRGPFGVIRANCDDPLCGGRLDEPTRGVLMLNRIELFPSAFEAGFASISLESNGRIQILGMNVTGIERAVLTLGHEAAHARGIDIPPSVDPLGIHPNADRAGLDALRRFRDWDEGR